jgi:hypothetical protein
MNPPPRPPSLVRALLVQWLALQSVQIRVKVVAGWGGFGLERGPDGFSSQIRPAVPVPVSFLSPPPPPVLFRLNLVLALPPSHSLCCCSIFCFFSLTLFWLLRRHHAPYRALTRKSFVFDAGGIAGKTFCCDQNIHTPETSHEKHQQSGGGNARDSRYLRTRQDQAAN